MLMELEISMLANTTLTSWSISSKAEKRSSSAGIHFSEERNSSISQFDIDHIVFMHFKSKIGSLYQK